MLPENTVSESSLLNIHERLHRETRKYYKISSVYFKSQSKQQEKTNQYSYTYKPNISKLKCKIILVFVSNHKALDISLKILDSKVGNNIEYFTGNILKIPYSKGGEHH